MNAVTTRTAMFPSRLHEWSRARGFIEEFCNAAGVPRPACLRANLVVEELFMNTVKHGHAGGSDLPVWITLAAWGAFQPSWMVQARTSCSPAVK